MHMLFYKPLPCSHFYISYWLKCHNDPARRVPACMEYTTASSYFYLHHNVYVNKCNISGAKVYKVKFALNPLNILGFCEDSSPLLSQLLSDQANLISLVRCKLCFSKLTSFKQLPPTGRILFVTSSHFIFFVS